MRVREGLSLDEHVAKFDDPGKIATFSDGGKDAEAVRSCGEDLRSGVFASPRVANPRKGRLPSLSGLRSLTTEPIRPCAGMPRPRKCTKRGANFGVRNGILIRKASWKCVAKPVVEVA